MDFLSMIGAVPSVLANFSGSTTDPYRKQKKQVMDALVNETNPLYQQLYGQYRKENLSGLSKGVSEFEGQNRLASRMGRTPMFSEGREGEALFRQLMQGYQTAGTQAGQQARSSLQQQLSNLTGSTQQTAAGNASKLLGFENIANVLGGKSMTKPTANNDDLLKQLLASLTQKNTNPLGSYVTPNMGY
jgi:hypothetical protein